MPIILGTAREGRQSEKVAKFMLAEVLKTGAQSEIIDVRDYLITLTDNTKESEMAKNFLAKISVADALIIVAPEYNHGYPGELKLMLDLLFKEYANKPVGFCGVSAGGLGGVRVVEQLRLVAIGLFMIPIRESLHFSFVQDLFDEAGVIKDQSYSKRVETFLSDLRTAIK